VDVRVIAATNRDLGRAVSEGRFREDLYYRLHVVPIEVPPLRERGDDVVILAAAFAARVGKRMGRTVELLPADDVARLRAYASPGNIRELQNVIERAVITSTDGRLGLARFLQADSSLAAPTATDRTRGAIRTMHDLEEIRVREHRRGARGCGRPRRRRRRRRRTARDEAVDPPLAC
jgi:transcriptional regulator with GAF, ATPase, and Fis domain